MNGPSYPDLLQRLDRALAALAAARTLGEISHNGKSHPIQSIVLGRGAPKRALISAGIHGDEPAGVHAVAEFIESARYRKFLADWELTIIPCINPHGYEAATRHNQDGRDLNREFKSPSPPREVALVQSVFDAPYDLSMELHEDVDSPGYYLYQKARIDQGKYPGDRILAAVEAVLPVNREAEIDGMEADDGVIHRLQDARDMDWWPMALYSFGRGTGLCLTLETPGACPMARRVNAHLAAVEEALSLCR